MVSRSQSVFILEVCTLVLVLLLRTASAQEEPAPSYTLTGDLSEIRTKGAIRFLVHGEADHLPRGGNPKVAEQALARELDQGLGLLPVFVPVAAQSDLTAELHEGHGDVIVASLAVTPQRSEQITFTRPIRFRVDLQQ